MNEIFALIGFMFAGFSVIANDSVQTLGTFIASNKKVKWWYLWIFASVILIATILYSWVTYGGDISYGRLEKIPAIPIEWYHLVAPAVLLLLTQFGIPASTSLLILATFAPVLIFEKIILKSLSGYALAAILGFTLWYVLGKYFSKIEQYFPESLTFWKIFQWTATGFLWFTWLSHDIANTAIFLPRELSVLQLSFVLLFFVSALAYIFQSSGGKIQEIVLSKTNTTYIKAATMIDLLFAFILLFFKNYNSIPMSTTWVFVGLLAGREIAIALIGKETYCKKKLFTLLGKDALKVVAGLTISVVVILSIHFIR